jgi:hypothetical protein
VGECIGPFASHSLADIALCKDFFTLNVKREAMQPQEKSKERIASARQYAATISSSAFAKTWQVLAPLPDSPTATETTYVRLDAATRGSVKAQASSDTNARGNAEKDRGASPLKRHL